MVGTLVESTSKREFHYNRCVKYQSAILHSFLNFATCTMCIAHRQARWLQSLTGSWLAGRQAGRREEGQAGRRARRQLGGQGVKEAVRRAGSRREQESVPERHAVSDSLTSINER